MNCPNCGKEITGNTRFCAGCGSPLMADQADAGANAHGTTVLNEAKENKVVFILAYLGILFFLPLVSCPDSKIGRFHANQGLLLLLASIAGQIVVSILSSVILAISWRLWAVVSILSWIWAIAMLALMIIGMINANKGQQKPLPFIGGLKIIK